ncbi:ANTAR domain-containing protein [Oerskovia flava]|uniref:ANTAR domain-containing protein n=1 Tax=Oerskovia flava TaxID=2986422 RepID=UPI00223EA79F|nr:ANTAR domain-containing protein [Oerskovia sp. JB1-3-2]
MDAHQGHAFASPAAPPDLGAYAALPALAVGQQQRVGTFHVDVGTGTWWWSDEVYRIHGFEPREVVPTSELVLAHKHPDDREAAGAVLERTFAQGEPFALYHRVVDVRGRVREVVAVGEGRTSEDRSGGEGATSRTVVESVSGYVIDLTPAHHVATQRDVDVALDGFRRTAGRIEQAKGILMAVYDVSEEEAFAMLRTRSNRDNVRVRDLAEGVLGRMADGPVRRLRHVPFDEVPLPGRGSRPG